MNDMLAQWIAQSVAYKEGELQQLVDYFGIDLEDVPKRCTVDWVRDWKADKEKYYIDGKLALTFVTKFDFENFKVKQTVRRHYKE